MKSLFKLAAGAALGAVMAVSAHAEAVKIAFIDPLSGPFATTGTNGLAEWQYAVEELVNKTGLAGDGRTFDAVAAARLGKRT